MPEAGLSLNREPDSNCSDAEYTVEDTRPVIELHKGDDEMGAAFLDELIKTLKDRFVEKHASSHRHRLELSASEIGG